MAAAAATRTRVGELARRPPGEAAAAVARAPPATTGADDDKPSAPAGCAGVISVGAVGRSGARAFYSKLLPFLGLKQVLEKTEVAAWRPATTSTRPPCGSRCSAMSICARVLITLITPTSSAGDSW